MVRRFSVLLAMVLVVAACAPAKVYTTPDAVEPVREQFVQSTGVKIDAFEVTVKTAVRVAGLAATRQELDLDLYETVLEKADEVSTALKTTADALAQYEAATTPANAAKVDAAFAVAELALATVMDIAGPFMGDEEAP